MANDKVKVATSKLTALADAIRAKSGGSEEITLNDAPTVITTEIVNELTSITFTLPPKEYKTGDALDLTGMSVIAHYSHVSDRDVTSVATIFPSAGSPLVTGNNTITASYTEKDITKTASVVVIAAKAAGTYDASGNLLKSWDTLLADGDVITDYDVLTTPNDRLTRFANAKSIIIPDGLTSIGNNAFNGCTGLTSITIRDGVMIIGSNAFNGCTALTSITIPDSVTSIGSNTFKGCIALTSITIPDSVTSIQSSAFMDCTNLATIHYSGTATRAPWGAPNATVVP